MTINDQKRQAAIEFGKDRGWKLSDAPFDLETLARRGVSGGSYWSRRPRELLDHSEFYRVNRRAAAIVSHTYLMGDNYGLSKAHECADAFGLVFEWIGTEQSWYYPGRTNLVVFTPADKHPNRRLKP